MNRIDDAIALPASPVGCILVVDDDAKTRRLLRDLLEAKGYSVRLADDGQQALEKAFANPPDVILLDVMMPKMDGYEVCRHLRLDPLLAEVAIIMVTSLDDRTERLRGLEAGADDFITKPVDRIELQTRVRNVVHLNRYRKLLQERNKAQRAQAEIMSSCEATLAAWVRILERDDRVIPGCCDRVTHWALCLAKSAGMPENDLVALRWSALLHVIGAMTMPSRLRGRENLSAKEETLVRQQEAWIIETLAPVDALREALGILARCHEHWDGSGRPGGLKGDSIPLAGRVLAVALAWATDPPREPSASAAKLALLEAEAGRRFEPRLVEILAQIVTSEQARQVLPGESAPAVVAPAATQPQPSPSYRFFLSSPGTRAQFAVALALVSVIPLLVVVCLGLTGWLGIRMTVDQSWPLVALVLPFIALGSGMLAKYPIHVVRLRQDLERLAQGPSPARREGEDDLATIETLMRKVVKQAEVRVRTMEAQTEALLDAERQRVMIQSLGAACHHLGQPATVIIGYLEMTRQMTLPPEARGMLDKCQTAAGAVVGILERLQHLMVYRTEPYLPQVEPTPSSPESDKIVSLGENDGFPSPAVGLHPIDDARPIA